MITIILVKPVVKPLNIGVDGFIFLTFTGQLFPLLCGSVDRGTIIGKSQMVWKDQTFGGATILGAKNGVHSKYADRRHKIESIDFTANFERFIKCFFEIGV